MSLLEALAGGRALKKWTVIKDRRPPGLDIADRDRLYEVMERPVRDGD